MMLRKLPFIFGIGYLFLVFCFGFSGNKWIIRREELFNEETKASSIGGFYHFTTMNSHWRNIVTEQLTIARLSGLFNVTSNIYVTGLGHIADNKNISNIFVDPKFVYEYYMKPQLYEYPTLQKLENFCLHNNESLVWYAHSKGASRRIDDRAAWRDVLNHFVLDKWQLCYGLLITTNYTTCGAILTFDGLRKSGWNTYYAGNMWWAKCSHVNRLTRITKLDKNDRDIAELYVTSEPDIGHFNCFFTNDLFRLKLNKQNATCMINQPMMRIR